MRFFGRTMPPMRAPNVNPAALPDSPGSVFLAVWNVNSMIDDPLYTPALRFCDALQEEVGRSPGEWRSALVIAARAGFRSARNVEEAMAYACDAGWLQDDGNGNVCLTEKYLHHRG